MTIITPSGPEFLVNTVTADNQTGARTVQLAGGRFMVVWTGSYLSGPINNTNFANADVRAQIFNANGTPFGTEFVVNTTTAGVQIYTTVTLLSDGHVLVTWSDGIGQIYGGATEPQATLRGQEYDTNGVAVGGEFVIANAATNAIPYGIAATAGGGFVAVYQGGGTGGAAPIGNIVGQIFNSSNVATGSQFIVDNTGPLQIGAISAAVESDGNIIVSWRDFVGFPTYSIANLSATGVINSVSQLPGFYTVNGVIPLASGGHAIYGSSSLGTGFPVELFIIAATADGSISEQFIIATLPAGAPVNLNVSPLANGGAVASWIVPDATGTGVNLVTQAFTAIGNPIGNPIAVNTTLSGDQSGASIVQLTNGDFAITFTDTSMTGGDTSGNAIRAQIFHVDPTNQLPTAVNDRFVATGVGEGYPVDYLTDNDTDLDGDPLIVTAISNVQGGTVSFDFNTQSFQFTRSNPAGLVTFDYTISDGAGGTATANATLLPSPDDVVTARGGAIRVAFLANDYLASRPDGYDFSFNFSPTVNGLGYGSTAMNETAELFLSASYLTNQTGYGFLPVGQSIVTTVNYTVRNPATQVIDYIASINLTLEGWAQIGGTGADNLVGTSQADHLVGGTGAANILTGGAGDDWYTVSVAGDIVVENANEGFDTLWTTLSTYMLPQNIERLIYVGSTNAAFIGIGNSSDNSINGRNGDDRLYGAGGNDNIRGNLGNDRIIGGSGTDTASYTAAIGEANVTRLANGTLRVITTNEGTDYLRGVETLRFFDATQTLTAYAAQDSNGDGDSDGLYFSQSTGLIYRTDFVNGAAVTNTVLGNMGSGDWDVQASGDFNYDGASDLVLKNAVTGQFYVWTVTNGVQTGGFNLGTIGTNWNIASTGDFNADGNHDLLWRDASNGHLYVWTFNASGAQTGSASLGIIGTDWTAGKSGDFDGDGDSDVLLRNSNTGQVYIYTMQSGLLAGGRSVGVFGTDWGLAATGDFNGDGISDIILKNSATGQFYEFLMNSDGSSTGVNLGIIGTDWNIATSGDYNKDGTDDILWRNTSTGQTYLWAMEDGIQAATGSGSLGPIANDLVIV
jgi:Bacterial Ig domain/FG-GAP-like repeat/RTX calcium-binding nonapeptide repeat (4 copies)